MVEFLRYRITNLRVYHMYLNIDSITKNLRKLRESKGLSKKNWRDWPMPPIIQLSISKLVKTRIQRLALSRK